MKKSIRIFTAAISLLALASCSSADSLSDEAEFENMLNSVVKIDVWETVQEDGGNNISRAIGSGVIMDSDGTILTNAHVANMYTTKIVITLTNLEKVGAKFVGWDHWTDLAVIRMDTEDLKKRGIKFSHAKFGDSNKLKLGETVYAAGTPHGFARTLTHGIVSNTKRFFEGTLLGERGYETGNFNTWIQTDAAINPGNSGGPLALKNGDVVGINTRSYIASNNLGFSVPSSVAKTVMEKIVKHGKVDRSYIGISPAPLQDMEKFFEIDANTGMLVKNVDAGSPVATAGILPGDIILKINGKDIDGRFPEQIPDIMNSIALLPIGSNVDLECVRNGKIFKKTVKTELLESRIGREFLFEKWGVGVREITKPFAREEKIPTDLKLIVIGVKYNFPFNLANIEKGDVIVSVNRQKISSIEDLEKIYEKYSDEKILLEIFRSGDISFHVVYPSKEK